MTHFWPSSIFDIPYPCFGFVRLSIGISPLLGVGYLGAIEVVRIYENI